MRLQLCCKELAWGNLHVPRLRRANQMELLHAPHWKLQATHLPWQLLCSVVIITYCFDASGILPLCKVYESRHTLLVNLRQQHHLPTLHNDRQAPCVPVAAYRFAGVELLRLRTSEVWVHALDWLSVTRDQEYKALSEAFPKPAIKIQTQASLLRRNGCYRAQQAIPLHLGIGFGLDDGERLVLSGQRHFAVVPLCWKMCRCRWITMTKKTSPCTHLTSCGSPAINKTACWFSPLADPSSCTMSFGYCGSTFQLQCDMHELHPCCKAFCCGVLGCMCVCSCLNHILMQSIHVVHLAICCISVNTVTAHLCCDSCVSMCLCCRKRFLWAILTYSYALWALKYSLRSQAQMVLSLSLIRNGHNS